MAWSATCHMDRFYANNTVPATPLANSSRRAYACQRFGNVVPLVTSLVDAATMRCDLDPVGNESCRNGTSWPAYLNADTNARGGAPNGTASQPVGRRGIQISIARDPEFQFDWADDIGPKAGAPSKCESVQSSPVCHPFPYRTRKCPFSGIWWDHAVAGRRARSQTYFAAMAAAGGSLDFLSLDTEIGELFWALHFAGPAVPPARASGLITQRVPEVPMDPFTPLENPLGSCPRPAYNPLKPS
jgi:hypothetical protein